MATESMVTSRPSRILGEAASQLSLEDAVARFLLHLRDYRGSAPGTLSAYIPDLDRFLRFLATEYPQVTKPTEITRGMVVDFAFGLGALHLAPRTMRRKIGCLSSFFGFLVDTGWCQSNPASRIPLPKPPGTLPRVLSAAEAKQLVHAAATVRERCLLLVFLGTGIRRNEAVQIRLGDLDLSRAQLLVRGKGSKERVVPLPPEALPVIRAYLDWRGQQSSDRFFITARGRPATSRAVGLIVGRAARRAKLTGVTPHTLRHTFATLLIRTGADIRTVQELLGHASIQMTMRYLHSDMRTKARAVANLPSLV